ncbi:tRNA (adenosine(37)-N6)-threonylcarbamoyltransferase complex ATPase subunit type 1 TsaE [Acidihalobacter prosperus]
MSAEAGTSAATREIRLADEAATEALGAALAAVLPPGMLVFLRGQLGAGKTTLVRGLLRALGHDGPVRSPTYALVESYRLSGCELHHFDLYRLADPEELEFMGMRDFLGSGAICMIEWPERGCGVLPRADLEIDLSVSGAGRVARLRGNGERGEEVLRRLHVK